MFTSYMIQIIGYWEIVLKNVTLKNCLPGATNIVKNSDKENMSIVAMEQHLMGKIPGVLMMALLEML